MSKVYKVRLTHSQIQYRSAIAYVRAESADDITVDRMWEEIWDLYWKEGDDVDTHEGPDIESIEEDDGRNIFHRIMDNGKSVEVLREPDIDLTVE
jgi:hypothetical protein